MSARFGSSARRLSGIAAQALGWSPDTFWRSTPMDLANALGLTGDTEQIAGRSLLDELRLRFPDS